MKKVFMSLVLLLTLILLLNEGLVSTTQAGTNGYLLNCFCAKSFGRGGTVVAIPDNGSVLLANPAGLAFLPGRAIGTRLGRPHPQSSV